MKAFVFLLVTLLAAPASAGPLVDIGVVLGAIIGVQIGGSHGHYGDHDAVPPPSDDDHGHQPPPAVTPPPRETPGGEQPACSVIVDPQCPAKR